MLKSNLVSLSLMAGLAGAACIVLRPEATPTATVGLRSLEQQANVFTYNRQQAPSLDVDADGNVLVAWGSRRQEAGTYGVYGRLFDAQGNPAGGEIHINQRMESSQDLPAVAFGASEAWVVWQSNGQDGDAGTIVARRFGRERGQFVARGDEFVVNTHTRADQLQPAVAVSGDRALIAWTSVEGDRQIVAARLYDADGNAVSDEFRLTDTDAVNEWSPAVAARADGRFTVAWAQRRADGAPNGIFARQIAGDAPVGVASLVTEAGIEPSIDAAADGRFVIAWMAMNASNRYDAYGQRFAADGTALDAAFRVADVADHGWISAASVAMAADGRFVVAYNVDGEAIQSDGGQDSPAITVDVMARRFDPDGSPNGAAFRLNTAVEGQQSLSISNVRRVAWGADDRIVAAWQGDTSDDGHGVGISMQVPGKTAVTSLTVDESILANSVMNDERIGELVPPEFDPNHVPEPWDKTTLSPGGDFGFIAFQHTGWTPPDPDLAVGMEHILVAVNGGVRSYDKDGSLNWVTPLTGGGGFWAAQGAGNFVFDPVELYDPHTGRFILVCTEHAGSTDYLTFAISKGDDIDNSSTDWHKYRWNVNALCGFIDFPNLGVGEDVIWITTDCFSSPGGNKAWIIDKQAVMNGDATFPDKVNMNGGFYSLGAVKSYDENAPADYFITAENASSTQIRIHGITDPLGTPTVHTYNLDVTSYQGPPGAQQLGSSNRVATVGKRIKNGVYRNGSLWVTHTIGQGGVARMRWYEIEMNGWPSGGTPTLVQEGTQNLGASVHNWFGDVDVDQYGNAAFSFNVSSPSEYVSVQRTYRLVDDLPNKLRNPVTLQSSSSPENGSRWGDYGGVHQDPAEPDAFWSHLEYRTTGWRTWAGKWILPVVIACPEDLDGSGAVDFGDIQEILAAWGNAGGPEDLDDSGTVDFGDILAVLNGWGPCP